MHFGGPVHRFSVLFLGWKKWIIVSLWVLYLVGSSFVGWVDVNQQRSRWQPMSKPFMLCPMLSDSGCWNSSVVDTLGGQVQTAAPHQLRMGLLICPSWLFLQFLTVVVYVHVRVCKCLWNSLYTRSCRYNFAMVTSVFTSCGPFKKTLFTCAPLLLSFWRKYHESHTSCSSPLTQTGWRGTFFMKYDCERVIGWTYWGNCHK